MRTSVLLVFICERIAKIRKFEITSFKGYSEMGRIRERQNLQYQICEPEQPLSTLKNNPISWSSISYVATDLGPVV